MSSVSLSLAVTLKSVKRVTHEFLVSYRTGGGYFWSGPELDSLTSTEISRPAPKIPLEVLEGDRQL
ncbi:hypothetical protein, partial [Microcoleus sp. B7-D4]|uniref:hypothetical protein n=1 Tax=Microcoleus sp. B7-D4 TaxID=2818696 RepID=UPI002FD57AFC